MKLFKISFLALPAVMLGACGLDALDGLSSGRQLSGDASAPRGGSPTATPPDAGGTALTPPPAPGGLDGSVPAPADAGPTIVISDQECESPEECPGEDTDCATPICEEGLCGMVLEPASKAVSQQTPGDCRERRCDGEGGVAAAAAIDDSDVPVDGKECTADICIAGEPSNPVLQIAGDCSKVECDEAGDTRTLVDDDDLPDDDNDCTTDSCSNGSPVHDPISPGAVCDQAQGGRCVAGGQCAPTIMVAKLGTGSGPLRSEATPVFLERRQLSATPPISTIAMPTVASGNNRRFVLQGTTPRDGVLALSRDGRYLTLLGYDASPGLSSVSTSQAADVNRIVARVDASDTVDTSTVLLAAFTRNNARSAVSIDGSSFWVAGAGDFGGVHFIEFGSAGGAQILTFPSSVRSAFIFDGQLYGASGDSPFSGVFAIGNGLPEMVSTAAMLPGVSVDSPCHFVMFDRDAEVPGLDVLYVADDNGGGSGGGIQKWQLLGQAWSPVATFNRTPGGALLPDGVRGLTALETDDAVTLVATTGENEENQLLLYVDDGKSANPLPTLLSTAPANTVYRGVSLAP